MRLGTFRYVTFLIASGALLFGLMNDTSRWIGFVVYIVSFSLFQLSFTAENWIVNSSFCSKFILPEEQE